MLCQLFLVMQLSAFLAIAAPFPQDKQPDLIPIPVPKVCSASELSDRPTVKLFQETVRGMCKSFIPDESVDLELPQHTTITFEIPQSENKAPKRIVANVDWVGSPAPGNDDSLWNVGHNGNKIWQAACIGNFMALTYDYPYMYVTWTEEVHQGHLCMKEGGALPGNSPKGLDDWVVLGWNEVHHNGVAWTNTTMKFE